jgi:hypothetical protein
MAAVATELPTSAAAEPPSAKEDSLSVLKALAEASGIFVAVAFIGGWSYLAAYYRAFGLNPLELDISIPVVCTTAVQILFGNPLSFIAGALIVALAIFAGRFIRLGRGAVVGVLAVLLFIDASGGALLGRYVAVQDARKDRFATLPLVAFSSKLKDDPDTPSCVEFETYGSLDCKLLLHLNGMYYFFPPVDPNATGQMNVFTLSESDVLGVHVQQENQAGGNQ